LGGVHRDLKPENILLDENTKALVVADFGIARFTEEFIVTDVETAPASRLANFQYAAPEQRIRGGTVDARADIYALGLILNEMFTKQLAIGTGYSTIASIEPSFAYLDDVVARMLRQKANERPGTIEQVKQELAARGSEFITRQRISQLKQEVVPVTDLDDPLISAPPHLVGFDWDRGTLTLSLSGVVNQKWVWALQNMGSFSAVLGKGPEAFRFSGNKATVAVQEHEVQDVINYFKDWLPKANRVYEQRLRGEKREAETAELERIRNEIAEQEKRQRVLKSVKI
jgi:serine/threonine protein kinase